MKIGLSIDGLFRCFLCDWQHQANSLTDMSECERELREHLSFFHNHILVSRLDDTKCKVGKFPKWEFHGRIQKRKQ
jgi:hypothetical protein